MNIWRVKKIPLSANQIGDEIKRRQELEKKQAELLYEEKMKALKGESKKPKTQVNKSVTINLVLPDKNSLKNKVKKLKKYTSKRNLAIVGSVVGVLTLAVMIPKTISYVATKNTKNDPQVAGDSKQEVANFRPLLPTDSGKPKAVNTSTCSNNSKLICFQDEYLNSPIRVTQQKLDPGAKIDTAKLVDLAKSSFQETSASDYKQVKTKKGNAVIVSFSEIGAQRVIYATDDMLVFIESQKSYSPTQWQTYLDSLI